MKTDEIIRELNIVIEKYKDKQFNTCELNFVSMAKSCKDKIEEKDKEIERLKAREEKISKMYLAGHKYASEMEGKYVLAKYVIDKLEKYLEEEQTRLARECSNIYEDGLGKTRLVNEDIFNEITRIKNKLKELKEGK